MRLSEAEWSVMDAVWADAPATARDVLDRAGEARGWAYTTVKTQLDRLVTKGALTASKRDGQLFYAPLVTRDQAQRSAVRDLVDKAFDGTFGSLVHHMVAAEKLSPKEREELRRLLEKAEGRTP